MGMTKARQMRKLKKAIAEHPDDCNPCDQPHLHQAKDQDDDEMGDANTDHKVFGKIPVNPHHAPVCH